MFVSSVQRCPDNLAFDIEQILIARVFGKKTVTLFHQININPFKYTRKFLGDERFANLLGSAVYERKRDSSDNLVEQLTFANFFRKLGLLFWSSVAFYCSRWMSRRLRRGTVNRRFSDPAASWKWGFLQVLILWEKMKYYLRIIHGKYFEKY